MFEQEEKWLWMINWCLREKVPPANSYFWNEAKKAYETYKSTTEQPKTDTPQEIPHQNTPPQ